ncbi:hypothetical protein KCU92_g8045, partial [Aureobasidium melanogenum]
MAAINVKLPRSGFWTRANLPLATQQLLDNFLYANPGSPTYNWEFTFQNAAGTTWKACVRVDFASPRSGGAHGQVLMPHAQQWVQEVVGVRRYRISDAIQLTDQEVFDAVSFVPLPATLVQQLEGQVAALSAFQGLQVHFVAVVGAQRTH